MLADGLKFTTEHAKSVQAWTFVDSKLFHDFHTTVKEEAVDAAGSPGKDMVCFSFQLQPFLQCLNIFGNATPHMMEADGGGVGGFGGYSGRPTLASQRRHDDDDAASAMGGEHRRDAGNAGWQRSGFGGGKYTNAFASATAMKMVYQGSGHDLEIM